MVQPSCVHVPSITVNVVSLVRETRNRPAFDSTRATPPTLASGVPVVVTRTRAFANGPGSMERSVADPPPPPLGPVGDPSPPQPVTMLAKVAQEATQAPQNWRREMGAVVSDIVECDSWGESPSVGQYRGHPGNTGVFPQKCGLAMTVDYNFDR